MFLLPFFKLFWICFCTPFFFPSSFVLFCCDLMSNFNFVFDSFSFALEVFSAWHLTVGWSEVDELPGTAVQGVDFQPTVLWVAPCPVPTPSAWNLQALGFPSFLGTNVLASF